MLRHDSVQRFQVSVLTCVDGLGRGQLEPLVCNPHRCPGTPDVKFSTVIDAYNWLEDGYVHVVDDFRLTNTIGISI
ncbi:hypothetical protein SMC6_07560 [Candidatus Cryosericum odellii]|uniref:Uncharacterized protein n=1 Tax=Candidatus Cryosericum odellii TaxID=2290917 RepID=A0A398D150_9BACT|nr:hypothetical protein SMC6_07560 [Candidatus Cryosericum odellii]RIE08207.1 hypothetical protein SMC5_08390 [Candidatus Cryosericum odellii]